MPNKTFSTKIVDKSWVYPQLQLIKNEISQKIDDMSKLSISLKSDNSVVTEVDQFISDLFKTKFSKELQNTSYFSEEDQGNFQFPMIILDPIDGTKELVAGIGECAVSFGIYASADLMDKRNFSWIYNPFTGMEISSDTEFKASKRNPNRKLNVMISRTEEEKGLYCKQADVQVNSVGSIANKLMLLAYGLTDAVISRKPKNIWDIMAGTHICNLRGIPLHINGTRIEKLDQMTYGPEFFWSSLDRSQFQI